VLVSLSVIVKRSCGCGFGAAAAADADDDDLHDDDELEQLTSSSSFPPLIPMSLLPSTTNDRDVRLSVLWTGFTVASKVLNDIIADEENLAMVRVVSRDQWCAQHGFYEKT
jgi:hypothetical protein